MSHASLSWLLENRDWQMTAGERSVVSGVVSELEPELAIEIGSAEGADLACIAAHSREVHSFDLVLPVLSGEKHPNVTLHTGDSHDLLPKTLESLAEQDINVDFALVDGDHSADGVRDDLEALLDSPAVARTVIMIHDTANETVRAGLEAIDFAGRPKVKCVDLDFVPGYLVKADLYHHEIRGGLGIVIVDDTAGAEHRMHNTIASVAYPTPDILTTYRAELLRGADNSVIEDADDGRAELDGLRARTAELEDRLTAIEGSRSWRATAPLRELRSILRRPSERPPRPAAG